MQEAKTWVIAVVALIIGAAAGYYVGQGSIDDLNEQISTLQAELEEKTKMIEEQAEAITEGSSQQDGSTPAQ